MPGENKILKFAGSATNVLTQEEYEDDAQRASGHVPGVARSQLANKEAKQATAVAAGVAQFIADRQDADVVDGLTPEAFSAMLAEAIVVAVPNATDEVKGVVELSTVPETQVAGTGAAASAAVVVTPASLQGLTATLTRRGLVELATSTGEGAANEVITGTKDDRAVTPLGLARRIASTTLRGIVELATSEETAAGEDEERAVTPKGLADLFTGDNVLLESPGYAIFPNGLIVQWGSVDTGDSGDPVVFPVAFTTACFGVQVNATGHVDCGIDSFTTTQFVPNFQAGGETGWWFAYGF